MTEAIITVEGLGKKYSLRHQPNKRHRALRDVLTDRATNLFVRGGVSKRPTETLGDLILLTRMYEMLRWYIRNFQTEGTLGFVSARGG